MWASRTLKSVVRSAAVGAAVVAAFASGVVVGVGGVGHTGAERLSSRAGSQGGQPGGLTGSASGGGSGPGGQTGAAAPGQGAGASGQAPGPAATGPSGAASPADPADDPVAVARAAIEADSTSHPAARSLDAAAVKAMLASLDDPWASYHAVGVDDAATATLDGSYAGLGLWLRTQSGGVVSVASVLPGSSAERSGISPGDEVVAIGGRPVVGVPLASLTDALHGRPGTSITVSTRSGSGGLRAATLVRQEIADGDSTVQRLPGGIVLARVAAFSKGVAASLRSGLVRARAAGPVEGVVLDLRGDPGGLLSEGVAVAGEFLDGGPVVTYQRSGQPAETLTASAGGDTATPLAVLIDGGTASAAEVVAGALRDRHRALLVGSRSFGKGSVQEPVRLPDGATIELTVGGYVTPSGHSLNRVGLTPDIPVTAGGSAPSGTAPGGSAPGGSALGGTAPGDPALAEAEEVVGSLLADAGTHSGTGRG